MKIFEGKVVLITGHTGFKGSWLSIWLNSLGAKVVGLSDDVVTSPSNYSVSSISDFIQDYRVDIRDSEKVLSLVKANQPDFVFHLAAQALVRSSYENPIEMADHQYISSLFNFRIGLRAGALLPYALPMGLLKAISMAFYYRTTDTSTYLVEKIQNDHNYKQQLKIFFNMHLDSGYYKEMPVNVDLELRAKSGKFNSVQRRSAYMAEFMKACNHLEAEKKAIVGAKHVAEMKYFLLNGFSERDVVDKAHDDAQLFMGNKEAYQGRVMSPMVSRAIKHTVAGFISGLAVDTAVVYTLSQLL